MIERELETVERYRLAGHKRTAAAILDNLFDFVMGRPTESELRLLDGNR